MLLVQRDVKRTCPFCGTEIKLAECPVVCTSFVKKASFGASFGGGEESTPVSTPSGRVVSSHLGDFPVLRTGTRLADTSRISRMLGRLPRPTEEFDQSDLPRRACTHCNTPLPEDLDESDAYVLAVVGLNRAGKSYFLGSTLTAASRNEGLTSYGVESFEPLEDTASRLHREYYLRLFKNEHSLNATPERDHLEKQPLMFKVTMTDSRPFLLVTHDVSGEALIDRRTRAATASFVSRANALIFIADPLDMHRVAMQLPDPVLDDIGYRDIDQAALLEMTLRELRPVRGDGVPLALTISKSDLISRAMHRSFKFDVPGRSPDWRDDVRAAGEEVRYLLIELNEQKLVRLADEHQLASFHAVSVLGSEESRLKTNGRPSPLRVLDPLGTVLEQIRLGQVNGH